MNLLLQTSLGIHLSDQEIRLVFMGKSIRKNVVLQAATYPLPPDGPNTADQWEQELLEALRNFIAQCNALPDEITLGLPRKKAILRIVEIPAVNRNELRNIMTYEAPRHVPFPMDDTVFDVQILGENRKNLLDVLLVAFQRSYVTRILNVLQMANLPATYLDLLPFGTFNAYMAEQDPKDEALRILLDINPDVCDLTLASKGQFLFSRSFVPSPLFVSLFEGLRLGQPLPMDQAKKVADWLQSEVQRSLQAAGVALAEDQQPEIMVTGLGASDGLRNVWEQFFALVQWPLTPFYPSKAIEYPEDLEGPFTYTSAIGLAMRGLETVPLRFNLIPEEIRVRKRNYGLVMTIVLAVVAVGMLLVNYGAGVYQDAMRLKDVRMEIAELKPQVDEVERITEEYRSLQADVTSFKNLQAQYPSLLEIIRELTVRIPPSTKAWLTNVGVKNLSANINGFSTSPEGLVEELEASEIFEAVKLENWTKDRFGIKMNVLPIAIPEGEVSAKSNPSPEKTAPVETGSSGEFFGEETPPADTNATIPEELKETPPLSETAPKKSPFPGHPIKEMKETKPTNQHIHQDTEKKGSRLKKVLPPGKQTEPE